MVARTNRSTSRLPELPPRLAPGSPSTPLRYVSPFVYLVGLFRIEFTKSSLKKSESFIDFFLSSKKTLTRRLVKKSPIKKSENVRLTARAHLLFVFTRPRRAVWRHSRQGQRHHLRTTWHGPRRRRGGLQVCRLGRGFFGHRRNHDGIGRTIRNHARRRRGREDWHRSRSGRHDPNSNRRVNLSVLFLQTKNKFSERRERERERERERDPSTPGSRRAGAPRRDKHTTLSLLVT